MTTVAINPFILGVVIVLCVAGIVQLADTFRRWLMLATRTTEKCAMCRGNGVHLRDWPRR
jgi:hypothetical protein